MAEIVLGVGTSHTPQISTDWREWPNLGRQDQVSPYVPADMAEQMQPEEHERRWHRVQDAIKQLGEKIRNANLDSIVIFGDDQHEQFNDDNMPAIAIYNGDMVQIHERRQRPPTPDGRKFPEVKFEKTQPEYANDKDLANYLVQSLTSREFDISRINVLKPERGLGHAFAFLYQRLWPECNVPIVPVMVNTYYPPNYPTPKRCYNLGYAICDALQGYNGAKRVGILASGGLSHIMIDETMDRPTLEALQKKDKEAMFALDRSRLLGGTSEILNWIAAAGACEHLTFNLIDYIPGYRSLPNTGCAMAFGTWE